jgi:hypothetical protein
MTTSETTIANMALGHIGDSNGIASLDESSAAARACTLYYEQARDEVIQELAPQFARRSAALGLVTDYTAGTAFYEYGYAYRFPADALSVVRIQNGSTRYTTGTNRPPWRVMSDDDGRLVFTDQADAIVEYTVSITDVSRFTPDFVQVLALKLAAYIAPSLTGGDPTKLRERNLALYQAQLRIARWNDAQGSQADVQADSGFVTARE